MQKCTKKIKKKTGKLKLKKSIRDRSIVSWQLSKILNLNHWFCLWENNPRFYDKMFSLISISSSEMAIFNISISFNMNNLPGQPLNPKNFQSKHRHYYYCYKLSEYQNITRQNFAIHSSKLQYCAFSNVAKARICI